MLVGTDLKEIKYIAVEVIRKGIVKASNVECGLFMGIVKKLDKGKVERKFLALVVSDASVRLFNMDEYDIMTIDSTDVESRYFTVFTNQLADQAAAGVLLNEITVKLGEEKRLYPNDPNKELIDIDTYKDYPDAVLESDNLTAEKTTGGGTKSTGSTGSTYTSTHNNTTTTTKQEPTVTNIKRKGKLPKAEKLTTMREKVLLIASGDFEFKALPIPECDREAEDPIEDKKTKPGYLANQGPLG